MFFSFPHRSHPIPCLDGAGACPSDGCEYGNLEKLCAMANGTADEHDAKLKKRYKMFDPNRFSTRTINRIFKIDAKELRNLPAVPAMSEGRAEIFEEMAKELRKIEKRSKSLEDDD